MPQARVFLTSTGSEAVETAIKLARLAQRQAGHPERTVIISRHPSYHGVTYGALSATGMPANQAGFGPLVGDVIQVPHDDLVALDRLAERVSGRVAAVLAEPVIGAAGVHPAAPEYLHGLRERCDRWGAYLVLDEVICGFGRLGQWWGAQHYGVCPDLVTFAKGVTSGYLPVGGVLVGAAVRSPLEADPAAVLRHGPTYSGHPTTAAAALANLDILESEHLPGRAAHLGQRLGAGLAALVDGEHVLQTRGTHGIWALGTAPHLDAHAVCEALVDHGVIAWATGPDTVAFCPPLVITDVQIDRCLDATGRAITAVTAHLPAR